MRLQILGALEYLGDIHLQRASWTNPSNGNPAYTPVEFVHSAQLSESELADYKSKGIINEQEHAVLLPFARILYSYRAPSDNLYDHNAVLRDPKWHEVVAAAGLALENLLNLTFNAPAWLSDEP